MPGGADPCGAGCLISSMGRRLPHKIFMRLSTCLRDFDAPVDKIDDLDEIRLDKAATGKRGRSHAQAARNHGALIARHRILVGRDVRKLEHTLHTRAINPLGAQVHQYLQLWRYKQCARFRLLFGVPRRMQMQAYKNQQPMPSVLLDSSQANSI